MFPLRKNVIKQKNEQIWKQLTAYINENYTMEYTDNMPLFRP